MGNTILFIKIIYSQINIKPRNDKVTKPDKICKQANKM